MRVEYLVEGMDVSQSRVNRAEAAQERSEETRIMPTGSRREVTANDLRRLGEAKPHYRCLRPASVPTDERC